MSTREQITRSAAQHGYRLPTEAEHAAAAPVAAEMAANMVALTRGKITADEWRARNRAMRAEHGDTVCELAKSGAVVRHIAACG